MKFIPDEIGGMHTLELTRRNLQTLLNKLDDPLSQRTLVDPDWMIKVVAVEDEQHYSDRDAGVVFMPSSEEYRMTDDAVYLGDGLYVDIEWWSVKLYAPGNGDEIASQVFLDPGVLANFISYLKRKGVMPCEHR